MRRLAQIAELFDPACIAAGRIPTDLPLRDGRLVFLWQPPTEQTLQIIRRAYPDAPIIVGRFEAETAMYRAKLPYWTPADFFSIRALVDFELAAFAAQAAYRGPAMPTYLDMPLVDGDLPRIRAYRELLACAAMLLLIREAAPAVHVVSDWMGAELASAVGLGVRRLWRSDWGDANWPPRRWVRERVQRLSANTAATRGGCDSGETDVLILLAGWVEQRMLDSFPIEALIDKGHRCLLLFHRSTPALEALVKRTGVRCEQIDYPAAARDAGSLEQDVARWCSQAIEGAYFAPLRGALAACVCRLMRWPRWAPKLVAMHRLLTERMTPERPQLLLAPAEKDWGPYCGHYAARRLGIPSVGIKHASWLVGSDLDRLDDGLYFPSAAKYIVGYTPADAIENSGKIVWHGNPRVEKPFVGGRDSSQVRILVGARGMGPGRAMFLRRNVVSWNIRLIDGLLKRVGEHRVRVRLHPWDCPEQYPVEFLPIFLVPGLPLDAQLAEYDLLATTYSTVSLDAAAAGLPQLIWDHERMRIEQSEIARFGGVVSSHDLNDLCDSAERFMEDATYRGELCAKATRFPVYLRDSLLDAHHSMSANLVRWLGGLTHPSRPVEAKHSTFVHSPHEAHCV